MRKQKGFTLIELLVVIAIIGLLSTLAVVSLNTARTKARDARRKSDLKQISTAMELYMSQNDTYPTNGTCGNDGVVAPADTGSIDNVCGSSYGIHDANNSYLNSIPQDPQTGTRDYHYEGSQTTYCLSASLEQTTGGAYFVCSNGSCYQRANDCPESP